MRPLLLAVLLTSSGCHVAGAAVASTVTTKLVTNLIDLVVEFVEFDRQLEADWARMRADHDFLMRCGGARTVECRREWEAMCEAKRSCGHPPW